MEELLSVCHSRKRKESYPPVGSSTRSKSRMDCHMNRSGVLRPDPFPREPKSVSPETEPVKAFLGDNCNNASRISSIKDLRMRRVFTPGVFSVIEEEEEEESDKETEDKTNLLKGSDPDCALHSNLGDAKPDEIEKEEIMADKTEDTQNDFVNGLDLKDPEISGDGPNSKSKTTPNSCRRKRVFKTSSSSFSYRRLLPYLMDIVNDESSVTKIEIVDAVIPCKLQKLGGLKSVPMSFPEKNIPADVKCGVPLFDDTKTETPFNQHGLSGAENELGQTAEVIGASIEKECVQSTPPDSTFFSNTEEQHIYKDYEKGNSHVLRPSLSSKHDNNSINRPFLNPCSRLRLFNNQNSLSFRRMLPFLINNSCDSDFIQQPTPQMDLIKDTIELNLASDGNIEKQLTQDSMENLPSSECSSPKTSTNLVSSEPFTPIDLHTEEKMQCSSPKTSTNLFSFEPFTPIDLHTEEKTQCSSPKTSTNLFSSEPFTPIDLHTEEKTPQCHSDHIELEPCIVLPSSSPIDSYIPDPQFTSKETGAAGKQKGSLDMGLELQENKGEPTEASAVVSAANGSCRGILKRNRRGCRGLCNCLNCASFRLHAERAFEFSRNQMHDAEEVTSDLMSELANLRSLLEKSIVSINDLAAIQLNTVVIKEACNKALEAENLAKERLSHLNYDLDVHCRTPTLMEPKVAFANYIQERAIPVMDRSA